MSESGVHFKTFGCKVNQAETAQMGAALASLGVHGAGPADASVVVVNSCTVTAEADHKVRKAVRQALALPQQPIVVVTGCMASLEAEALCALGDNVVVVPDKEGLPAAVEALVDDSGRDDGSPCVVAGAPRTRALLKVQDGCDVRCAYCIVPDARGVPRSVPLRDVVRRAEELVADGCLEVVLTGVNIGKYGDSGAGLPALMREVARTGVRRLRISSIEPEHVDDRFLATAAETESFCPHLHVPLQSGADRVLRAMGRGYEVAAFLRTLALAREAIEGVAITTDVIAGFPGESAADHAETCALVESVGMSRLHVFRYSERAGTQAATMVDQVAAATRAVRAAELRALSDDLERRFVQSRVGRETELLIERVDSAGAWGTTSEYLKALIPGASLAPGSMVRVVLDKDSAARRAIARVAS
jgi:threonylcarbamoyladenosine tRNA methylthiotransferase MtaB